MDVLKLLELKNRCLETMIQESEEYLSQPPRGELSVLTRFQEKRAAAFASFELYDRMISQTLTDPKVDVLLKTDKKSSLIESVKSAETLKDKMIQALLALDQKIIARIEDQKVHLQRELTSSDKEQKLVTKFKSKWISESGVKLDGKL